MPAAVRKPSTQPPASLQTEHTAKITAWQSDKGYGWLQLGDRRIFLHVRDYAGPGRQPVIGEDVRFFLGQDSQGRPCATNAISVRGGRLVIWRSLMPLALLLILPVAAIFQHFAHPWLIWAGAFTLSLLTYFTYASDKRRARTNAWRIPEAHLHILELLGGWPGAWLAQKYLRHKSSKTSYRIVFWLIIALHQFLALDSLQNWRLSRALLPL